MRARTGLDVSWVQPLLVGACIGEAGSSRSLSRGRHRPERGGVGHRRRHGRAPLAVGRTHARAQWRHGSEARAVVWRHLPARAARRRRRADVRTALQSVGATPRRIAPRRRCAGRCHPAGRSAVVDSEETRLSLLCRGGLVQGEQGAGAREAGGG